jgi:hypothetical protein
MVIARTECAVGGLHHEEPRPVEADETALRHFEEGLVVQYEAILQYRIPNYPLYLKSRLQFGVHLSQDAIATISLVLVQRQIGAFQKPLRIGSVRGRYCNTDARRSNDHLLPEFHRRGHCKDEAACEILGLILSLDVGLGHDELVAAEPGHYIVDASYCAQGKPCSECDRRGTANRRSFRSAFPKVAVKAIKDSAKSFSKDGE